MESTDDMDFVGIDELEEEMKKELKKLNKSIK